MQPRLSRALGMHVPGANGTREGVVVMRGSAAVVWGKVYKLRPPRGTVAGLLLTRRPDDTLPFAHPQYASRRDPTTRVNRLAGDHRRGHTLYSARASAVGFPGPLSAGFGDHSPASLRFEFVTCKMSLAMANNFRLFHGIFPKDSAPWANDRLSL